MVKFHINPVTGEPGRCQAAKAPCPFGGPDEHFPSAAAAREAYEQVMAAHELLKAEDNEAQATRERWVRTVEEEELRRQAAGDSVTQKLKELLTLSAWWGTESEVNSKASRELNEVLRSGDWAQPGGIRKGLESLQDLVSDFELRGGHAAQEGRDHESHEWYSLAGQLENSLEGTYDLLS